MGKIVSFDLPLRHDFNASAMAAQDNGLMPRALAELVVLAQPEPAATYKLPVLAARYFPFKLEDLARGDALRALFTCYGSDGRSLCTRMDRAELQAEEKHLRLYAAETVTAWNLVQLRTAMLLIDQAPKEGRAVSHATLGAFKKAPRAFYAALTGDAPDCILQ